MRVCFHNPNLSEIVSQETFLVLAAFFLPFGTCKVYDT